MNIPSISLKHTDLEVSRFCFGTMTFGKPLDQAGATQLVNRSINAGINFFDTANVYQKGIAETMLGHAIKGKRDQLIIASKVHGKMGDGPDQQGLSRKAILRAIDESLERLGTDYLDLYYFHLPDYSTPIEESMEAMESLLKQGKVRYPAQSNFASWQVVEMLWLAKDRSWHAPYVSQPMYNLVARGIEQEYLPMCKEFGIPNVVYNPLAGGLLTGKHKPETITPGTRFDNNKMYQERYWHEQQFRAVEQLSKIAKGKGRSLVSLALNWLLHHTATDCIILGASRMEQLHENLATIDDGPLTEDVLQACDEVWRNLRGPLPYYNR